MTRLLSPDRQCRGVDVGSTRYNGTILEVTNPTHARMLKEAGYIAAGIGSAARPAGYVCTGCGFHALFTTCSRCGAHAVRPGAVPGSSTPATV